MMRTGSDETRGRLPRCGREAFDLPLNHAAGTRFATFVEGMATRETEVTRGQYDAYEGQGLSVRRLSDDQVHALAKVPGDAYP